MDLGLQGKCAAIAAGSAGLGFAIARALSTEGSRVAICGRRADVLDAAARELGALAIVADLSDLEQARVFIEHAIASLGRVDILVVNSGGPPPGTFASTSMDAYEAALQANLLSAIAMCRAAVPMMIERRWGRILAITSLSAREPRAANITTGMARAGLTAFLKALSREVAASGVTVNSLQPGPHDTSRLREVFGDATADVARDIPVGTLGRPANFAQVAAFLCSEQASFITGTALPVDGGLHSGLF